MKEEERVIIAQWWDMNGTAQAAPSAPTRNLVWVQRWLMRGSRNSFLKRKQVFKFREETGASQMGNEKQAAIQSRQAWHSRLFSVVQ